MEESPNAEALPRPRESGVRRHWGGSSPQLLLKLRFGLRNAVIPGQKYNYWLRIFDWVGLEGEFKMLIPDIIPSLVLYGQGLHPKGIAWFLPQDLGWEGKAGEQHPVDVSHRHVSHMCTHPAMYPHPLHTQMCAETDTTVHVQLLRWYWLYLHKYVYFCSQNRAGRLGHSHSHQALIRIPCHTSAAALP